MFILIVCSLFKLDNINLLHTLFTLLCVGVEKNNLCKTTSYQYLPEIHIAIYIHVVQYQHPTCMRGPNQALKEFYGLN